MPLKRITIIGTQGLPAEYGGFETLAEYLTLFLGKRFDILVYCSKRLFAKKEKFIHNNAELYYIPLKANGPQSILYDSFSIIHASIKSHVLLILGVSGVIVIPLVKLFSKKVIIINIDGIEYKREKWNYFARKYLKYAESQAVKHANIIIADNKGIQEYVHERYKKKSELIAYGADHVKYEPILQETSKKYGIPKKYAFKVCRIEPENNIELILKAFKQFGQYPLALVGNWQNGDYGKRLFRKYSAHKNLILLDPIYDQQELNQIRSNCYTYIHGHSAGGTNPSLVEAMYLKLPVIAFDVIYNRHTTENRALFFKSKSSLVDILERLKETDRLKIASDLYDVAYRKYTWERISQKYEQLLLKN